MKTIKCYYCGKREKHEFDDNNCCFSCVKLSSQERYELWTKTTNKAFRKNVKDNKILDKREGTEKLVDLVG